MILDIENPVEKPIRSYIGDDLVWQDSSGFTPAELFIDGEQGVWLDPSDLSTMFQDEKGTKPVTKDGDPVGLILDKSQGLQGESLLDTSYPFEMFDGTSREGDTIHLRKEGSGFSIRASNLVVKKGAMYKVSFYVERLVGSGVIVPRFNNSTLDSGGSVSEEGYYETYIRSSTNGHLFQLNHASSGIEAEIRDISVQEVKGNHATQETAAARPIYRTDGNLHWIEFDGVDDYLKTQHIEVGGTNAFSGVYAFEPLLSSYSANSMLFDLTESSWNNIGGLSYRYRSSASLLIVQYNTNVIIDDSATKGSKKVALFKWGEEYLKYSSEGVPKLKDLTGFKPYTVPDDPNPIAIASSGMGERTTNIKFYGACFVYSDVNLEGANEYFKNKIGLAL